MFLQGRIEQLQGQFHALAQGRDVRGPGGRRVPEIEAVFDGQEIGQETLQGVLVGVGDLAGGAFLHVIELGAGPQRIVPILIGPGIGRVQGRLQRLGRLRFPVRRRAGRFLRRFFLGHAHPPFARPDVTGAPRSGLAAGADGDQCRDFKARPSALAVRSTMGMTRS